MALPSIKNSVGMAVTAVADAGVGTLTVGAALSGGYQTAATAYGANANIDIRIEEGDTWEVCRDCTYTHSGTTVTRGTLEDGSSGTSTRVAFTTAAKVYVVESASRLQAYENVMAASFGFSVRGLTTAQTLTNGSFIAVTNWNTEDWDTNSCFVAATGVFTPTKAGRYQLTVAAVIQKSGGFGVDDGTRLIPRIYKNGSSHFELTRVYTGQAASFPGGSGTCIVQANGTTDYFDFRLLYSGSAGTVEIGASGPETTYFQARYLGN